MKLIQPALYSVSIDHSGHPELAAGAAGLSDIRKWRPANPDVVVGILVMEIGPKHKKGGEEFYLRVATPAGLELLEDQDGILATGWMVIIRRWDSEALWRWLQGTVASCQADSWEDCISRLRQHFRGEFDSLRK